VLKILKLNELSITWRSWEIWAINANILANDKIKILTGDEHQFRQTIKVSVKSKKSECHTHLSIG